ncbi:MAG: PD40 domain-containing protein [Phycisphaerales bacterium]|nr:PD40 domain-containing protein [Phycisphaerales bacterium]
MLTVRSFVVVAFVTGLAMAASARAGDGYYRMPTLHADTVVFVSEGDLWRVDASGGIAERLTSHPDEERTPALSPDGAMLAFVGAYEGSAEVYVMPLAGGVPERVTYGADRPAVVGWTPDGRGVIYSTRHFSTLPDVQLVVFDRETSMHHRLPLAQASDGGFDGVDGPLYFTRLPFQGSWTKRYKGGTAQQIWRFGPGDDEATPLTGDFAGTSATPMPYDGRVYFVSDRDGTMNLWSMSRDGGDLRQHTRHDGWDVKSPALSGGRIVYQLGADLRRFDIASGADRALSITLRSDFDQMREQWVEKPMTFLTDVDVAPDGESVVLTARGEVFVAPRRQGRFVQVTRAPGVRYRHATFMPDGESLLALSDERGELDYWRLPLDGVGAPTALTNDGDVVRGEGVPSPDGLKIAYADKNFRLWIADLETGERTMVAESAWETFGDLVWSPDGAWLAFVETLENAYRQVRLYDVAGARIVDATSDRIDSFSPSWSPDGDWLAFLADRDFTSVVESVWGHEQPEPFLDRQTTISLLALDATTTRSPFLPDDEVVRREKKDKAAAEKKDADAGDDDAGAGDDDAAKKDGEGKDDDPTKKGGDKEKVVVTIDVDGLAARLHVVPVPRGNYEALTITKDHLFWIETSREPDAAELKALKIDTEPKHEVKSIAKGVTSYRVSRDGKRLLVRRKDDLHVVDANAGAGAKLDEGKVNLGGWTFTFRPAEQWRQMFVDAWRMERDYFYDPGMHGVDWTAMRDKYLPLVERVRSRQELSDLLGQLIGELSALHMYVAGGDRRDGPDTIAQGSLGARLVRDDAAGGYRVERVYRTDPDFPNERSPLARPEVDVRDGDVITAINGVPTLSVPHACALLRDTAGRQVLLHVTRGDAARAVIVEPIPAAREAELRYDEWEYTRRLQVDEASDDAIGYVHLRAMGAGNFSEFARHYYPVFTRQGLIVDVRHNRGGNIDSWVLSRLMREIWMYWQGRVGKPTWNMQHAFPGHIVVLCDEFTASDGEAFAEGFRRLGLGQVIGTRTWGGEIWLSFSNRLVDNGIASAAEYGVYGPEGEWLIEGHGVEPDIVVDNLPHETFNGRDAQLERAIAHLRAIIERNPVEIPAHPAYPDKSR